jgi:hypothetical protein
MPSCPNGHEVGLILRCDQCGLPISYRELLPSLATIPAPQISFEEVAVISVGMRRLRLDRAYTCEVVIGDKTDRAADSLTLEKIGGGTWFDYYKAYGGQVSAWLELVNFERPRYKFVVVDSTDPLSVLVLSSLGSNDGALVLMVVADAPSTPVKQNTSFVALEALKRKGLPFIAITESQMESMSVLAEGEGLYAGRDAIEVIAEYLVTNILQLQDFLRRDLRLGIAAHYFFALMSGSDIVYRTPRDAFKVLTAKLSAASEHDDFATAYMIASAAPDKGEFIQESFEAFSKGLGDLFDSDSTITLNRSALGLFDIILILGVRNPRLQALLEKGYLAVAKSASELEAGALEKTA